MSDFLSPQWFEETNATLSSVESPPLDGDESFRVVFEFDDAPSGAPHALTFSVTGAGTRVEPGDHLLATTIIRLSFDTARRITLGSLDSASALREGRLKVRGDVRTLDPLLSWLFARYPHRDDRGAPPSAI